MKQNAPGHLIRDYLFTSSKYSTLCVHNNCGSKSRRVGEPDYNFLTLKKKKKKKIHNLTGVKYTWETKAG
jgi:hypothetical protein